MLRQSITFLRARGLSNYLPLDEHIHLHKMAGITVSILSLIHTIMHLLNFSTKVVNDEIVNASNYTIVEWLFTSKPGLFGFIPGWANPTGILLAIILLIIFICSQSFVRKKGSFEVFYWTHLLYIPFWILCGIHGPSFWKWFFIPGTIYIIERMFRVICMRSEHGKTYISSGLLLPSKVTHLVIKRPLHFNFTPGDYIFLNIPTIAKYEWHPFTISSAPEQEDYMWLHIRTVGEWTTHLYQYFERKQQQQLLNGGKVQVQSKQMIPSDCLPMSQFNQQQQNISINIDDNYNNFNDHDNKCNNSCDNEAKNNDLIKNLNITQNIQNDKQQLFKSEVTIETASKVKRKFVPSKLATESYTALSSQEIEREPSITGKGDNHKNDKLQCIKMESQENKGYLNEAFAEDSADIAKNGFDRTNKISGEQNYRRTMMSSRPVLEKSLSMSNMAMMRKRSSKPLNDLKRM